MNELLAIARRRKHGGEVSKSNSCNGLDGNASCYAAPAEEASLLCCEVECAAKYMKAKGEPRPQWSYGRPEPRAEAAEHQTKAHPIDQVLLYVTCQRISILIDDARLNFWGGCDSTPQIAKYAVGDSNHFHVQERIFHWLTLELSGGEAVRLERIVRQPRNLAQRQGQAELPE